MPHLGSIQRGVFLRRNLALLLLIVAVGAALRFHMLGMKSIWPVEGFSVLVARLPWHDFIRTMWWGEANMALYYSLLRGWLQLGDSEFWLRSLSVLFGVITIPAIYGLGNRFLSREVGFSAAALFAIHSFHIQYSQELRSYSLSTLLVVLSTYAFLAAVGTPDRKVLWLVYVLLSALSLYAQVFTVFVLCSQWLAVLPGRIRRIGIAKLLSVGAAIGILASPMAAVMLLENKGQLDWVPHLSLVGVIEIGQSVVGAEMAVSQRSLWSAILTALYLATWILAIRSLWGTRPSQTTEDKTKLAVSVLALWLAFPIALMTVISLRKPILYPRYVLMCVPAAVLMAGQGLSELKRWLPRGRLLSSAALLIMMALTLGGTLQYFVDFQTYGHDWRGVSKYLLSEQRPGDAIIFYTFSGHWSFDYYVGREREIGYQGLAPVVLSPLSLDRSTIEKRTEPYDRVWMIVHQTLSTSETDLNTELIRAALQTRFHLAGQREFPGDSETRGENGTIRVALYVAVPARKSEQ